LLKSRNPFLAVLLSFIASGLGQLYNKQPAKAALLFGLGVLPVLAMQISGVRFTFYGLAVVVLSGIGLKIWSVADAWRSASRAPDTGIQFYQQWPFLLVIGIGISLLSSVESISHLTAVDLSAAKSGANEPSVLPGDYVLSEVLDGAGKPALHYGDLLVIRRADHRFMYRLVGLPGDMLAMNKGVLEINRKPVRVIPGINGMMLETLPNDFSHQMRAGSDVPDFGPVVVPAGNYFVLGDNRRNAADSRYFGPLSQEDLEARARFIFWSSDLRRIGARLDASGYRAP
jgi:signal peptidase I